MKVTELFKRLSYGELSNLSVGNDGAGTIEEVHQPKLIHHINAALLTLFSRFRLSEKELLLIQVAHITHYHLIRKFAESTGADVPHAYIKDLSDQPFTGDVIRVLSVHSEFGQVTLNDQANSWSIFTPQPDVLQVPDPREGRPLTVQYQARHPKLDDRDNKIIGQEIEIPFFLESALQFMIGSRVFSNMNGQDNIVKGQEYLAAYEAACVDVEQRDLVNQSFHTSHSKLEQRGFV